MWLVYGVDSADQSLVFIGDVPRGKTGLQCPYCGGTLTAKKGPIVGHHFAHTGETCRAAARADDVPTLPLYDRFHLHLSGKELEVLRAHWQRSGQYTGDARKQRGEGRIFQRLVDRQFLQWNTFRQVYEFTKLGKVPFGALSLDLFNALQEPLIMQRLAELEHGATWAWQRGDARLDERLTDVRLYRAQLRRILLVSLYFLNVQADGQTLYKVGVTLRPIAERIAEIQAQLRTQFQDVQIAVVGIWPHRGNMELYFKHRYQAYQRTIGTLTEYFVFDDPKPVIRDLRRMQPKVLTPIEQAILAGAPAPIEQAIADAARAARRARAIRSGMQHAVRKGTHVGRPEGGESAAAFLAKPASQLVIDALDRGRSIRAVAKETGVAINTVRKVAALRQQQQDES